MPHNDDAKVTGVVKSWADKACAEEAQRMVEVLRPLIEPLQQAIGPDSEVLLHNLTTPSNSVAAIAGTLSGRAVGAPVTDLGLRDLVSDAPPTNHIGYRLEMPGGIICKASTIFLNGNSARPVVALCINVDIRAVKAARDVLDRLVGVLGGAADPIENAYADVSTLSEGMLAQAIESVGIPLEEMSKVHKINVVRELDQRGFFLIREAAELAGNALGVSRFTIYNYLAEAR